MNRLAPGREKDLIRSHRRATLAAFALSVLLLPILWKLTRLQVVQAGQMQEEAERQHHTRVTLTAERANIIDRNGNPLAIGVQVPSLFVDPSEVEDPVLFATMVAKATGLSEQIILDKINKGGRFQWLVRRGAFEMLPSWDALRQDPKCKGLGLVKEHGRRYPHGALASNLLGFTGVDGGLEGLEYAHDGRLQGGPREVVVFRDAVGRIFLDDLTHLQQDLPPLELTLDLRLQYIAEEELARQVALSKPRFATVVMMEPFTGEILAVANYPSFDGNDPFQSSAVSRRNWAVMENIEPGSTFKVITAAALLDRDLADPGEAVDCGNGRIRVGGITIKDHKAFEQLSFNDVLAKSSNVGMIRLGSRLSNLEQWSTIRAFGFGEKTGSGFPGEARGVVREPANWSRVSGASLAMGQEMSATPLQLVRAMSAVANGGYLVTPKILKTAQTPEAKRIIRPETAATLTSMLEGVTILGGTGKRASVKGWRVAGKTGTAQKIGPSGTYKDGGYCSSFMGFVPADNPSLAMIVVIDEPQGLYYGGEVAAPVFSSIAQRALPLLGRVNKGKTLIVHRQPDLMTQPEVILASGSGS